MVWFIMGHYWFTTRTACTHNKHPHSHVMWSLFSLRFFPQSSATFSNRNRTTLCAHLSLYYNIITKHVVHKSSKCMFWLDLVQCFFFLTSFGMQRNGCKEHAAQMTLHRDLYREDCAGPQFSASIFCEDESAKASNGAWIEANRSPPRRDQTKPPRHGAPTSNWHHIPLRRR